MREQWAHCCRHATCGRERSRRARPAGSAARPEWLADATARRVRSAGSAAQPQDINLRQIDSPYHFLLSHIPFPMRNGPAGEKLGANRPISHSGIKVCRAYRRSLIMMRAFARIHEVLQHAQSLQPNFSLECTLITQVRAKARTAIESLKGDTAFWRATALPDPKAHSCPTRRFERKLEPQLGARSATQSFESEPRGRAGCREPPRPPAHAVIPASRAAAGRSSSWRWRRRLLGCRCRS